MEDFIPKWGDLQPWRTPWKNIHCFTIDDDMIIKKSYDKNNEEFCSGKTFCVAIPSWYLPVQS